MGNSNSGQSNCKVKREKEKTVPWASTDSIHFHINCPVKREKEETVPWASTDSIHFHITFIHIAINAYKQYNQQPNTSYIKGI